MGAMSRLILVRHAQASFGSDDYDMLSPLGEAQALALGEHWLRLGAIFDEVLVGPRRRQVQTEQIIRDAYHAVGRPWPSVEIRSEFDEHCVDRLLGEPLAELVRLHPGLSPLAQEYRIANNPAEIRRAFQRLFEAVCHLWREGAAGTESIEPWSHFQSRVESVLHDILGRGGRNRTIGVFASVGNITAALRFVLNCSPSLAFELGWRLRNCCVTELIFSGNRVTLDQFNSVAHLPDPKSWTFR
jgi:broad specificity phosphatase PhoE